MGCRPPGEVDFEDDDREFLAAAQRDDAVVAELLIRLSRAKAYAPRDQPPEPANQPPQLTTTTTAGAEGAIFAPKSLQFPLSTEMKWGRRGPRSRWITMEGVLAARKEEARRASPTTPLSWSCGSGTSGSVCAGAPPAPLKRRKVSSVDELGVRKREHPQDVPEPAAEIRHGRKQIRIPAAKRRKHEPHPEGWPAVAPPSGCVEMEAVSEDGNMAGDSVVGAPASVVSSSTSSGSNKAAESEPSSSRPVVRVEPLRFRLTADGVFSLAVGRPGKKKTLAELKVMRGSLLQEQEGLREELGKQKEIYDALLEENLRLKKLESCLSSHTVRRPTSSHAVCEEAKLEQPQHLVSIPDSRTVEAPRTASATPQPEEEEEEEEEEEKPEKSHAPLRKFLFDLNCIPDDS